MVIRVCFISFPRFGIGLIVALLVACLLEYSQDFTSSIISFKQFLSSDSTTFMAT